MTEATFLDINIIYWLIAYGGALIHGLMKVAETPENKGILASISRKERVIAIASLISIPVLLLIMTDTVLKELLPLNYLTAFLTGYQTQSILRFLVIVANNRYTKQSPAQPEEPYTPGEN